MSGWLGTQLKEQKSIHLQFHNMNSPHFPPDPSPPITHPKTQHSLKVEFLDQGHFKGWLKGLEGEQHLNNFTLP